MGERADLAQPHAAPLRQVGRPDLHRRARDVRHEHVAVAVEDRAARRLHADVAALVVLRGAQELLAVQHLQRPEAQKEDREDGEREHAEEADAQRELRRQPVRLRDARVGRQEAAREHSFLAKEPHLPRDHSARPQQAAHERVHGQRSEAD